MLMLRRGPSPTVHIAAEGLASSSCPTNGENLSGSVAFCLQRPFYFIAIFSRLSTTSMWSLTKLLILGTTGCVFVPVPPHHAPHVKPRPPPLAMTSPMAQNQPAAPRRVPPQPHGFPYHTGGWFGGTSAEDLLEGWWAEWNPTAGIVYVRQGRRDYEEYSAHPLMLAVCEAIRPPSDLAVISYPVVHGRWHGEEDQLRDLEH